MTLLLKKKRNLNKELREIGEFAKISDENLNRQTSVGLWVGKSKYIMQRAEKILHRQKQKKI